MRLSIATPIIAFLLLGIYHKIIKTIIIMGLCFYYAFNVVLISNDSINSKWMTRILNNINAALESVALFFYESIHVKQKKRKPGKSRIARGNSRIIICTALAMQANASPTERVTQFDTDSVPIGIDNRCSACISHKAEDFIGQLQDSPKVIKGFGGTRTTNVKVGTLSWTWTDDKGVPHKFNIPNSYYVPTGKVRLLSPQHWAKEQRRGSKRQTKPGTLSQTTDKEVTLMWNDRKNRLTVPLSPKNNVATFHLAPGFNNYYAFCTEAGVDINESDDPIICEEITGENDDVPKQMESAELSWKMNPQEHKKFNPMQNTGKEMQDSKGDSTVDDDIKLMLHYHNKFGHLSFRKLKIMAKQGIIPRRLENSAVPVCTACAYAKMTKRQWRSKQTQKKEVEVTVTTPGQLVSVDQLVSPTPGLIAQMTGILTTKRYKYATVYVDQFSRLGYVHLQRSSEAEETVQGKLAFERYMQSIGVSVQGYQADNGIFRANKWQAACREKNQSLSFTGVNAHHQNGHAERRIRELQDAARAMLIHANRRWPRCVTTNLWPYTIKMASDVFNNTPCFQHKEYNTPLQVASRTNVNKKYFHTFGCPVYVLDNALQESKPFGKWNIRSKVGIYIGQSPNHNKRVALVLDRKTGLVSPQYHVQFDDDFTAVQQDTLDSDWLIKAGFVTREYDERSQRPVDKIPLEVPGIKKNQGAITANDTAAAAPKRKAKEREEPQSRSKKLRRSPRLQTGTDSIQELLSMQVNRSRHHVSPPGIEATR